MPKYSAWRAALATVIALLATAALALAQGTPFNILRPADGAIVREKVRIEVPRASIPQGGFVGIYIDGKFHIAGTPTGRQGTSPALHLGYQDAHSGPLYAENRTDPGW